jgi:hypothetical protein
MAVIFFSGGGDSGGGEHEATKMNNEDKKIAKLVKESGNRSHKFSPKSESVFFDP